MYLGQTTTITRVTYILYKQILPTPLNFMRNVQRVYILLTVIYNTIMVFFSFFC